jgi:hypothetical protein
MSQSGWRFRKTELRQATTSPMRSRHRDDRDRLCNEQFLTTMRKLGSMRANERPDGGVADGKEWGRSMTRLGLRMSARIAMVSHGISGARARSRSDYPGSGSAKIHGGVLRAAPPMICYQSLAFPSLAQARRHCEQVRAWCDAAGLLKRDASCTA